MNHINLPLFNTHSWECCNFRFCSQIITSSGKWTDRLVRPSGKWKVSDRFTNIWSLHGINHKRAFELMLSFHCSGEQRSWTGWRYSLIIFSWRKRCEFFFFFHLKACFHFSMHSYFLTVCVCVSVFVEWSPGASSLCRMFDLHLHLCVCGSDVDLAKVSVIHNDNNLQENKFHSFYFNTCSLLWDIVTVYVIL